jgi:carbamoyltransferase
MSRKLFEYHPAAGYRFIPGLKARIDHEGGGYLVRVNQAGFRCDHEFAAAKAPDAFRILLFGDSFTAGDGVSNRDRYGDWLQALLPGVEVFNFGLSGTGTDQQYLAYREFGLPLEHDLVIAAVYLENIRRVAARFRAYADENGQIGVLEKPYYTLEDGRLTLHNFPPKKEPIPPERLSPEDERHVDWGGRRGNQAWLRQFVTRIGLKDVVQKFTRYQPLPHFDRADHPAWRLLRAILCEWNRTASAPLLVVPIPVHAYIEGSASAAGYRARFRELAEQDGLRVHDPLDDLLRYSAEERRSFRFEKDTHFTPAGHRALAESLARVVAPYVGPSERQRRAR